MNWKLAIGGGLFLVNFGLSMADRMSFTALIALVGAIAGAIVFAAGLKEMDL